MIDYDRMREAIVTGLRKYLGCPVIKSNSNGKAPDYPYVVYTVITPLSENKGTYAEYEDGTKRKPYTQTWSITVLSEDDTECLLLAFKAREWLDEVGRIYLNDNDVIVQSVGSIGNRDNLLTSEYEYRKGFDVVFWLYDTIIANEDTAENTEYIETVDIGDVSAKQPPTPEELNSMLENRLDGEVS